jgi:hypothetical protein
MLGEADDPQRLRIERQIEAYWDGPTPDVEQAQQQWEQASQQVQSQVQQMAGQMLPEQAQQMQQQAMQSVGPEPMAQAVQAIFAPLPVDAEPAAAQMRWQVLRDAVAQVRVAAYPRAWQVGLFQAYDEARKAAGVMTVAEQQQMAQAAQQAEQQKEASKVQAETQQKVQLKQMDAQMDAQRDAAKDARTMEREQMQAAVRSTMRGANDQAPV